MHRLWGVPNSKSDVSSVVMCRVERGSQLGARFSSQVAQLCDLSRTLSFSGPPFPCLRNAVCVWVWGARTRRISKIPSASKSLQSMFLTERFFNFFLFSSTWSYSKQTQHLSFSFYATHQMKTFSSHFLRLLKGEKVIRLILLYRSLLFIKEQTQNSDL